MTVASADDGAPHGVTLLITLSAAPRERERCVRALADTLEAAEVEIAWAEVASRDGTCAIEVRAADDFSEALEIVVAALRSANAPPETTIEVETDKSSTEIRLGDLPADDARC